MKDGFYVLVVLAFPLSIECKLRSNDSADFDIRACEGSTWWGTIRALLRVDSINEIKI